MEDHINVGHPFYFPTQVALVDDDPDFLEGVSLMLDKSLSYRLFHSATQALDYVNESHRQVNFLQRCYNHYKTGPQESDSLSHVDIGKLHEEIFNNSRFQTCSTVIVDYSMPEMNGLEFLMALKNPYIKKVLLTGQADMELAIKAFNKQLIDQFIDKHDPRLKQILNSAIHTFSDQYFRSSFKLVTDPIVANNHDGFLADARFQEYFEELRRKTNCVEYYMIDHPHHGYLMVDSAGKRRCLLVYSERALQDHVSRLEEIKAPTQLIREVKSGEYLPIFDEQDEPLDKNHPCIQNWQQCYYPAVRINSVRNLYATVITDNDLPGCYTGNIIPYNDFMESNSLDREILH